MLGMLLLRENLPTERHRSTPLRRYCAAWRLGTTAAWHRLDYLDHQIPQRHHVKRFQISDSAPRQKAPSIPTAARPEADISQDCRAWILRSG